MPSRMPAFQLMRLLFLLKESSKRATPCGYWIGKIGVASQKDRSFVLDICPISKKEEY